MRKHIIKLFCISSAAMLIVSTAGCGSNDSSNGGSAKGEITNEQITEMLSAHNWVYPDDYYYHFNSDGTYTACVKGGMMHPVTRSGTWSVTGNSHRLNLEPEHYESIHYVFIDADDNPNKVSYDQYYISDKFFILEGNVYEPE